MGKFVSFLLIILARECRKLFVPCKPLFHFKFGFVVFFFSQEMKRTQLEILWQKGKIYMLLNLQQLLMKVWENFQGYILLKFLHFDWCLDFTGFFCGYSFAGTCWEENNRFSCDWRWLETGNSIFILNDVRSNHIEISNIVCRIFVTRCYFIVLILELVSEYF